MAFQPKTEPGSLPWSVSTSNKKEYGEMSISELVSVLRIAYKIVDFDKIDKIEQELVKREAKHRAEIGPLREKIELERLNRIEVEERLKIREEQCEEGKRAQENYEQLLEKVKTGGLVEKHATEELRKKNVALEREVCELKEFRKIMLDEMKSVAELRDTIRVLKEEKVGDKNALDALNMKNIELEEAVEKNLKLEKRYRKLRARVMKLEENIMLLMCENHTEVELNPAVSFAVKDEKDVQSPKKGNKEDAVGALGMEIKILALYVLLYFVSLENCKSSLFVFSSFLLITFSFK
ncbi:uncharacterized protein LOC114195184 [Vigna unguiculata]|uniref:uncharacterized protein LOC114195184 n=1 Tax=Vigna unguiculata TaxID=3917 RepID=UPI001017149D|nr:uncharacterized protein LOC114195184 [Vigna unguiculata]